MLRVEDVTACLVTRGDVSLDPILDTIIFPETIVWDNSEEGNDFSVYGRYMAALYATTPVVYFQDDDALVTSEVQELLVAAYEDDRLLSNMPSEHNLGHPHLALLGWGSLIRKDLCFEAHHRWKAAGGSIDSPEFMRLGCDIMVSVLTPSRRVDYGHTNLPNAHTPDREHLQSDYLDLKEYFYHAACKLRG